MKTLFPVAYNKPVMMSLSLIDPPLPPSAFSYYLPTRTHSSVAGWWRFSPVQSTNMSKARQRGWVRFPYSRITTAFRTWQCMKWIWRLVCIVARPLHPPTGHMMDPDALGKDTLYILGSGVSDGVIH